MLQLREEIDTKYLKGEEFVYTGKEMKDMEINARDVYARNVLIQNGIKVRFQVKTCRRDDLGGFTICNTDYKSAAFDGFLY